MVESGLLRDLLIIGITQSFTLVAIWLKEYYFKRKLAITILSN